MRSSHATVNLQNLSRKPTTLLSRQEPHNISDLLRLPNPPLRIETRNHLQDLLALALQEEICCCGTWSDGIDHDAFAGEVFGETTSHLLNCALGCDVGKIVGGDCGGRTLRCGEENDTSSGGHVWRGFLVFVNISRKVKGKGTNLSEEEGPFDVEVKCLVKFLLGDLL